jgi:1,4-alpha-glucan branching enzyme
MKPNRNGRKSPAPEPPLIPVRFEFADTSARSVCVAGCFNHWNPESKALARAGDGLWRSDSELPPGTYQYRLVVDGHWIADPMARESVPNPFGGRNSVLKVARSAEAAHRDAAEHRPFGNSPK